MDTQMKIEEISASILEHTLRSPLFSDPAIFPVKKFGNSIKKTEVNFESFRCFLPNKEDSPLTLVGETELPVYGTYIHENIVPGYRYKVKQNGTNKMLFNNQAKYLENIGQGYGRRLTFQEDNVLENGNFFWSDSNPLFGYSFYIEVISIEDSFSVKCNEKHVGFAVVKNVDETQTVISRTQGSNEIQKDVKVSFKYVLKSNIDQCEEGNSLEEIEADAIVSVIKRKDEKRCKIVQMKTYSLLSLLAVASDYISYDFNIRHADDSKSDAFDAKLIWYVPKFLKFVSIESASTNITTTNENSAKVVLKIGIIPLSDAVIGKLKVRFDENEIYGKWQHGIVVLYQIMWYDRDTSDSGRQQLNLPLMFSNVTATVPGCIEPLGMSDGRIKIHQLSAKSSDPALRSSSARPNSDGWCAKSNGLDQYFQVILSKKVIISKITTWGRYKKSQWVTKFKFHYSLDYINWQVYKENGYEKELVGNAGPSDIFLLYPFEAIVIRIFPLAWKDRVCMRFELYGCETGIEDSCIDPVGIENGKIPDEAFQDSIPKDYQGVKAPPSNARLNKPVTDYPFGWRARSTDEDWIQVDLGSVFKITGFAVQGSAYTYEPYFYVQTYKVLYSNNARNWNNVTDGGKPKIFHGPPTAGEAKFPYTSMLTVPIYGRYFRITPLEFISSKVMRFEMYGCLSADGQQYTKRLPSLDLDLHLKRRSIILDPVNDYFYACNRQRQEIPSCLRSKTGVTWQEINPSVKRVIGLDTEKNILYGMDSQLRHLSKEPQQDWNIITSEHWNRILTEPSFRNATEVPDIFVSKTPSQNYQWASKNGVFWGVSGDGIHRKPNAASQWKMVAAWQC
eukprot:gene581-1241_t